MYHFMVTNKPFLNAGCRTAIQHFGVTFFQAIMHDLNGTPLLYIAIELPYNVINEKLGRLPVNQGEKR